MKPLLTDAERRLIAAYTQAALLLSRELASFKTPADKSRILLRIDAILRQLDQLTAEYVRDELPQRFKDGSALALAELRALHFRDLDTGFTDFHVEAVRQLAEDAKLRFAEAIQAVKRFAAVRLSEATKQLIMQKMIVDQINGVNPTKAVKGILQQQKIIAIRTRNGQERGLEDYADTLVRQTTGEAQNAGAASRYAANGVEYARVIERPTACRICRPMNGKIIWLGDPRLRPLYHPRCEGGIEPIAGKPDNPVMSPDDPRIPQVTRDAMLRR